ncbi:MAG TPA: hypothetical protein VGE02_10250 [Gemmatimonadales bacterium]
MPSRAVTQSSSSCPHAHPCAESPHAHAPVGVSLRVSLRAPALRWAAAVVVAIAGRCTVVAHMEPLPTPPAAEAPAAEAPAVRVPAPTP